MAVTIYVHLTWTTRERAELIDQAGADFLRDFIPKAARRRGGTVLATGIVSNHVHLVVLLPSVIDIPKLVQGIKGASARIANRDGVIKGRKLRWASGYDLRSISPRLLRVATANVHGQDRKHPALAIGRSSVSP